jgi:hypothetical protein
MAANGEVLMHNESGEWIRWAIGMMDGYIKRPWWRKTRMMC